MTLALRVAVQSALILPILLTAAQAAFDPTAATNAYLASVPADVQARTNSYVDGGYVLDAAEVLYAIVVAWLLLGTGLSQALRALAERVSRWRWLQALLYGAQYALITSLAALPLGFYRGYLREHEFGLSNHTIGTWLTDRANALLVSVVLFSLLIAVSYAVIRRAPRTWHLWGAAVLSLFFALAVLVSPVFIEPLFNTYRPMDEGPLKDEILALAHANGVPGENVFVVDASRQTKRISANVSGLLGTTRIALNDNLLNGATPAEIKAVMAHEIGHYALGHIYEFIVYYGVMFLLLLIAVRGAYAWLLRHRGGRWGVRDMADPAGLPALVALLSAFSYLATPVFSTITRTQEAEADIFGLNAAREPDGFATVILKLATYRKLDPLPFEEAIFFDHPSARSRIYMAMEWKAGMSAFDEP